MTDCCGEVSTERVFTFLQTCPMHWVFTEIPMEPKRSGTFPGVVCVTEPTPESSAAEYAVNNGAGVLPFLSSHRTLYRTILLKSSASGSTSCVSSVGTGEKGVPVKAMCPSVQMVVVASHAPFPWS